jgi:hypothetical protein
LLAAIEIEDIVRHNLNHLPNKVIDDISGASLSFLQLFQD